MAAACRQRRQGSPSVEVRIAARRAAPSWQRYEGGPSGKVQVMELTSRTHGKSCQLHTFLLFRAGRSAPNEDQGSTFDLICSLGVIRRRLQRIVPVSIAVCLRYLDVMTLSNFLAPAIELDTFWFHVREHGIDDGFPAFSIYQYQYRFIFDVLHLSLALSFCQYAC